MTDTPALSLRNAELTFGARTLWSNLTFEVAPAEFVAVLGPNGSGKTSLIRAILGQQPLTAGTVHVGGAPVGRGSQHIGYIPQQKLPDRGAPLRSRDLVALGIDGHRWGMRVRGAQTRQRVDDLLADVGAASFADTPVASLSGGEQQRVRVAQAIATDPQLLLCDEPLGSLDLHHQREISQLINRQRTERGAAVIFVTHDVNPVLGMVDRVLYLVGGQVRVGTPDDVLRSEVLSEMYGTTVEVIHSGGRIAVLGAPEVHGVHHHPGGVHD